MSGPASQQLFELYQSGHSDAATAIFDRYIQRLIALVRGRLAAKLKRRVDPEDVVQSAFRSFFLHAAEGDYRVTEAGDLWRLLAGIAINKLYGQVERHTAAKRSIQRETPEEQVTAMISSAEPTAAEAVAVYEQLQLALKSLSADEQFVLAASLQGQDVGQIAKALGKSARTVRRLLALARQQLEERLLAANEPSTMELDRLPTSEPGPEAPLKYADYTLERIIGAGGMGKVFRARDKRSDSIVAIQALHKSRLNEGRAVRQFLQEAQVLASLNHPNIVALHGLGRFPSGSYFLVMDFVDGVDLQSRLDTNGRLPVRDAIAIVVQVASAVEHAHQFGIVHSDLKPANVLVNSGGRAIVTDFGFAYLVAGDSSSVRSAIGGTLGYVAPELLTSTASPSFTSDVYGLGALLWALCTGVAPNDRPPALDGIDVPAEVAAICVECLALNPNERFTTAGEVRDALAPIPRRSAS